MQLLLPLLLGVIIVDLKDEFEWENIGTMDLRPSPQILEMLGNIEFSNWQCLAELIDNAIDALLPAGGNIIINTPSRTDFDDGPGAAVRVWDDGYGMSAEQLRDALRAGYSGQSDPFSHLGLFGMGFNIATARLGRVTQVKTTIKGDPYWTIVTIDFNEMKKTGNFLRPVYREKKVNPEIHGTEIIVTALSDRVRTIRHQSIKKQLSRTYAPILTDGLVRITIDNEQITSRGHCVWGAERYVERDGTRIYALTEIDHDFGSDYYCKNCWEWLGVKNKGMDITTVACPRCGDASGVMEKKQHVKGWIGVQRYYDHDHYGIDLIRNGRIIEPLCKDFFSWFNPGTEEWEKEYPVEGFHFGGRIVGELDIDFVPLTYMKDRFEKADRRWKDVERYIRGPGPFRPKIAQKEGFPENTSPLGLIYKGYRKANDAGKGDLLPGGEDGRSNNVTPKLWADKYYEGDPEYQDDHKWYELVELAEKARRSSGGSPATLPVPDGSSPAPTPTPGTPSPSGVEGDSRGGVVGPEDENKVLTVKDPLLSQEYELDALREPPISVTAYRFVKGELEDTPMHITVRSKDKFEVLYDPRHPIFSGFNIEPMDLLLLELSQTLTKRKDDPKEWPPSRIFCLLKEKYSADRKLSPANLADKATELIASIRKFSVLSNEPVDRSELEPPVIDEVRRNVLNRLGEGEAFVTEQLATTKYLAYAPDKEIRTLLNSKPELFFDGKFWNRPYASLGTDQLREEVLRTFSGYVTDILWLKEEAKNIDPDLISNDIDYRLQRASFSLRLLEVYRD